jgi:cysteine desulfurase
MPIYLDNAATTRVAAPVADLVTRCMRQDYGNPSSAHHMGIEAERHVKAARAAVLSAIGDPDGRLGELYWTSGGTEADALGLLGAARARAARGRHVVVSAIEHPAVRACAELLGEEGFRADQVPVTPDGVVDVERFADAIGDDTQVAALMLVNNEIGTIMPVAEVARALRARRPEIHLHCDAVQALGKIPVDVTALGADSVAFAAHKLHGPKGVGCLWLRKGARLRPLWAGGGQQGGVRSGTLHVPAIAGMGEAARLAAADLAETGARWGRLREIVLAGAAACGVATRENGAAGPRAPHIVSISFEGAPAEPLLHVLESRGVLVSAGSACAERSRKPSPVLTAIGVGKDWGTLRLSFGRETTEDEVRAAADILAASVRDL